MCYIPMNTYSDVKMEQIFLGAFVKLRQATISVIVSMVTWNYSIPTLRIFMKFDVSIFIDNLSIRFKFHLNLTKMTDN